MGRLVGVSPAGARGSLRRSGCQAGGRRRDPGQCSHGRKSWKPKPCSSGVGRSARSPAISVGTARRSGRTCPGSGPRVCAGGRRPEVFEPFAGYVAQRLADDRHVWATTLFDEVVELGYPGSYPSFTRALRARELRPSCPACAAGAAPGVGDHRPSGRGGDPVRLAGAARPAAGVGAGGAGASAGRVVGALEPVAGGAGRVRGPAAPDRGPRRGGAPAGRGEPVLAVRPDGHGVSSRLGSGHRELRRRREALRRRGEDLPVAARAAQGGGGEGQPQRGAALVAHSGRRAHDGRRAGRPGPVLRPGRRRPHPPPRRRGQGHRRPSWPPPSRCWRRRPRPTRRSWRSRARCRRRRWSPSAATPTRCRRGWRAGS